MIVPDIDRKAEKDDIAEMHFILEEMDKLEARRQAVAARLASRYAAVPLAPKANAVAEKAAPNPPLDEPEQQYAYEFLSGVGRSVMKPMVAYVRGKGCDLGDSLKPGSRLSPKLKARPDVFSYEKSTEIWSLV